uniref:Transcriptional regulator n=1 Tax=Strongyloides venezuelensis TaxID=75913 RepID=A0A0K0G628_STRVS
KLAELKSKTYRVRLEDKETLTVFTGIGLYTPDNRIYYTETYSKVNGLVNIFTIIIQCLEHIRLMFGSL